VIKPDLVPSALPLKIIVTRPEYQGCVFLGDQVLGELDVSPTQLAAVTGNWVTPLEVTVNDDLIDTAGLINLLFQLYITCDQTEIRPTTVFLYRVADCAGLDWSTAEVTNGNTVLMLKVGTRYEFGVFDPITNRLRYGYKTIYPYTSTVDLYNDPEMDQFDKEEFCDRM
jgi:hypothetical protein